MSEQQKYFDYYCLDRIKTVMEELPLAYKTEDTIKKIDYRIALEAKFKGRLCYILYTEDDFDLFIFSPVDFIDENRESLMLYVQDKETIYENIQRINSLNIFQFLSLLNFNYIYQSFKEIVDYNWDNLGMDSLIEL